MIKNAVDRTIDKLAGDWSGNNYRLGKALQFIKKATKSDKKRKIEKASRKRNRKR